MHEDLFSEKLRVTLRSHEREDRVILIRITVELHTHTAPLHKKELVVRLTDESDLFFLYTLKLGEEDFQTLKAQQGLLVDFNAFPQKFIDLLELSLQEENKNNPRYLLEFTAPHSGDTWILNVIETNPFKHLVHLSLRFLPGRDADVKTFLAECLKIAKTELRRLENELETTEEELREKLCMTQSALSERTVEVDTLKLNLTHKTTELCAKYSKEIALEKEKSVEAQTKSQQRYERERKELEEAHLQIVKQLEGRLYETEHENKELTEAKYRNEAALREQKSRLTGLEEEYHRMKNDLSMLRKDNSELDADYHDQEKVINQLHTRVAVLEQEIHDKEALLTQTYNQLQGQQQHTRKGEEDAEKQQRHINKLESSVKTMSEELVKGNEIIKKLQGEIRSYHAKVKLRNQITTEQEKIIEERTKDSQNMKHEISTLKDEVKNLKQENKNLNETLESTVTKLEESKQLLKTNENVINWLNRQITENQLSSKKQADLPPMNTGPLATYTRPLMHNNSTPALMMRTGNTTTTPELSNIPRQSTSLNTQLSTRHDIITYPKLSSTPEESSNNPVKPILRNKENEAPFLDMKYLQRGDGVPLRTSRTTTPTGATTTTSSADKPGAPKASAYFPTQAKVS